MRSAREVLFGCAILLVAAHAAHAQTPPKKANPPAAAHAITPTAMTPARMNAELPALKEEKPGYEARATVKVDAATQTALKQVPNGHVLSRTIEERGGGLVYLFRIRGTGQTVKDVWVNAMSGAVIPAPGSASGKGSAPPHKRP